MERESKRLPESETPGRAMGERRARRRRHPDATEASIGEGDRETRTARRRETDRLPDVDWRGRPRDEDSETPGRPRGYRMSTG